MLHYIEIYYLLGFLLGQIERNKVNTKGSLLVITYLDCHYTNINTYSITIKAIEIYFKLKLRTTTCYIFTLFVHYIPFVIKRSLIEN